MYEIYILLIFRSGKISGLMQDRDSFFNDRITHLDDIQFTRNTRTGGTRTGILIEDEKDFSDVRKVSPESRRMKHPTGNGLAPERT